ncbi:MAG: ATP-binding protein [Planctomycetes bacterium]|nr:ATP-binding protein [Planctomycetota bacterium]
MQDFEKRGVFYLGREAGSRKGKTPPGLILYDSCDLVTHAVCVGMTGSGKTGLCVSILEEAAIDGIPAIAIDPKGDIANLLLTFPGLRGEDVLPWINEDEARKNGVEPAEFAEQQAELWKKGLAEWGEDGARIQRLCDSADFAIYTPGSMAGLPLSVLKSFAAPDQAVRDEVELLRDRVNATTTSLLGMLGIDADPVQSREHILLANIFSAAWHEGNDLGLHDLIPLLQQPPFTRVGVIDLESFYPAKDRFALAMKLNNLLAAPGFEVWMQGEPLDIGELLYTTDGKPRMSIISISHLSDAERMFVVSLILNQMVSWVRTQSGTTSLRALLYMDEIFGYFPPTANPPSKQPLLTLLKQARADGVGVVLATQNPVDLDYKGLGNAGTWFIGRLQTERDKARVLEGLEGAAGNAGQRFDRSAMEQILAGLGKRVFLMNNVHEDAPVVFDVRWALSYLRGPLTREQIKRLMDTRRNDVGNVGNVAPAQPTATPAGAAAMLAGQRPVLPPSVPQCFLPVRKTKQDAMLVYRPRVIGLGKVLFADAKMNVDDTEEIACLASFGDRGAVAWESADVADVAESELEKEPVDGGQFDAAPPGIGKVKNLEAWKKAFIDYLYRTWKLPILHSDTLGAYSKPRESARDFRIRLQQAAREERDALSAKLRERFGPKLAALQERIRRSQQAVAREAEQARQSKFQTLVNMGATVLGAVLGRKKISVTNVGKAASTVKSAGKAMKDAGDVARAQETVAALEQQLADLEARCQEELHALHDKIDPTTEKLETIAVKLKKSNISVRTIALAWAPFWSDGMDAVPAWK